MSTDSLKLVTQTIKLPWRVRWALRRAYLKGGFRRAWCALRCNHSHPVKTYREFKAAELAMKRQIERDFWFGPGGSTDAAT